MHLLAHGYDLIDHRIVATPLAEIAGRDKPIDASLLELARVLAQ